MVQEGLHFGDMDVVDILYMIYTGQVYAHELHQNAP